MYLTKKHNRPSSSYMNFVNSKTSLKGVDSNRILHYDYKINIKTLVKDVLAKAFK